jgi:pyrroloquinoline quinone (PQQ) biosynthesis protein C
MVKPFLQHSASEVGHDGMALSDLEALGYATANIPNENPLPSTIALTAFASYAMQHRSPASYLGTVYFLEFLPTSRGGDFAAALARIGVPATAMSFLAEHREADVHHNRLMKVYADYLIKTPEDVAETIYAMQVTGRLFRGMLEDAFDAADTGASTLVRSAPVREPA